MASKFIQMEIYILVSSPTTKSTVKEDSSGSIYPQSSNRLLNITRESGGVECRMAREYTEEQMVKFNFI